MSDARSTAIITTNGGVTAEHIALPLPEALVAPTNSRQQHNTIRAALIPFACWRANDMRFEFESSFVLPEIALELGALKQLIDKHTVPDALAVPNQRPALTVFGHADPTGNDEFNKALSGRRAQAIYGLLTRRTDLWEELFNHPADHWGKNALESMIDAVASAAAGTPNAAGLATANNNGSDPAGSRASASAPAPDPEREKQLNKLQHDGAARKKVFKAYMDTLCVTEVFRLEADDQTRLQSQGVRTARRLTGLLGQEFGTQDAFLAEVRKVADAAELTGDQGAVLRQARKQKSFEVSPQDFLGGGSDKAGKADYQGCGEFNPVFLQPQNDIDRFNKSPASSPEKPFLQAERDAANEQNRRVLIFLFRPEVRINPDVWPCPRVKEGTAGCHKRFFSDGEARRNMRLADQPRKFDETKDTFACRFYDRLSRNSPCEEVATKGICFIFVRLMDDAGIESLGNRKYTLRGRQTNRTISGVTSGTGIVRHDFLPDDYFELECSSSTEFVPVYYMSEKQEFEGRPWFLRFRGVNAEVPPSTP